MIRIYNLIIKFAKKDDERAVSFRIHRTSLDPVFQFGALSLLHRDFIAAWHWGWSLTWRWIFSIKKHEKVCKTWALVLPTKNGRNSMIGFNTPVIDVWLRIQNNILRSKFVNF